MMERGFLADCGSRGGARRIGTWDRAVTGLTSCHVIAIVDSSVILLNQ